MKNVAMPRKITRELLVGFMAEVQDSILVLGDLLERSAKDGWNPEALEESHRLAHSMKGAASMVQFPSLQLLANLLEQVFEDVLSTDGEPPESALTTAFTLWESIAGYVENHQQPEFDERSFLTDGVLIYQCYFELEKEEDLSALNELLEGAIDSPSLKQLRDQVPGTPSNETTPSGPAVPEATGNAEIDQEILTAIDQDLDNRENLPAELLEVFNEEAEDHLSSLYKALGAMETDRANRDLVQELRRAAHTLKGAAGAVGLRTVTQVAHRMEDLLDRLYDEEAQPNEAQLKLLYQTTDALQDLAAEAFDRLEIRQVVARLYQEYNHQLSERAAQAPPAVEAERTVYSQPSPVPPVVIPRVVEERTPAFAQPKRTSHAPAALDSGHQGPALRVPLERLDEMSRLVGELIINRSSLEQRMGAFRDFVEELHLSLDRLRRITQDLESQYSVDALGGGWKGGRVKQPTERFTMHLRGKPILSAGPSLQVSPSRLEEFDELEFDRYTEFHLLARSLSEVTNDVGTVGNELKSLAGDFDALLTRQSRLSRETQDRLTRVRMVPLGTIADRLKRTVRMVADQLGKTIQLVIEGELVELDKNVLEELADPLLHLLRNAADHGIESPEERERLGKPPLASIEVRAFPQGTQVVLEVKDDGRGLDPDRLRAVAVRSSLLTPEQADALTDDECYHLIFEPGFTTCAQVTEVSGRGVGMDVVRSNVRKLKGTISIATSQGEGTTFSICLPMTLAITRALLVKVRQQIFAVPMPSVVQILRVDPQVVDHIGSAPVIQVGGQTHPLHRLADRLGLPVASEWEPNEQRGMLPVVILSSGRSRVGFMIDAILGAKDVVVKSLGTHLGQVKGLLGATLLGDGTVVPILDPVPLVGEKDQSPAFASGGRSSRPVSDHAKDRPLTVLVADDSVSVRRVMTNLIKSAGWNAVEAKDGRDAIELLQSLPKSPDVFLLDIEMPRMDGYELLAFLRAQDSYQQKPIVMVTSRAGEKHRNKALDLGASGYVVKPYQDEVLLGLIRELADGSRSRLIPERQPV